MVSLLLTLVLAQAPAAASSPPPTVETAAPAPQEGALERQLARLPSFFWDTARPLEARLGRLATFVLIGVGLASLALASAGAALVATIQLSPYPTSPGPYEVPRVRYAEVGIAFTTVVTVLGVVGVAVGVFALLIG